MCGKSKVVEKQRVERRRMLERYLKVAESELRTVSNSSQKESCGDLSLSCISDPSPTVSLVETHPFGVNTLQAVVSTKQNSTESQRNSASAASLCLSTVSPKDLRRNEKKSQSFRANFRELRFEKKLKRLQLHFDVLEERSEFGPAFHQVFNQLEKLECFLFAERQERFEKVRMPF